MQKCVIIKLSELVKMGDRESSSNTDDLQADGH